MELDGRASAAKRQRTADPVLRVFVREHQSRRPETELRMTNSATRVSDAEGLPGPENPSVEVNRGVPSTDAKIREYFTDTGFGIGRLCIHSSQDNGAGKPRIG